MSSKENKTREEVAAVKETKKLAKHSAKNKGTPGYTEENRERKKSTSNSESIDVKPAKERKKSHSDQESTIENKNRHSEAELREIKKSQPKPGTSQDEVDKASVNKEQILAKRAARKEAKLAMKAPRPHQEPSCSNNKVVSQVQSDMNVKDDVVTLEDTKNLANAKNKVVSQEQNDITVKGGVVSLRDRKHFAYANNKAVSQVQSSDMTVKDVVVCLTDIKNVANKLEELSFKEQALDLDSKKRDAKLELGKSKAELKAERRAKQEAQRAAKLVLENAKVKPSNSTTPAVVSDFKTISKEKPIKRVTDKKKVNQSGLRRNWFGQEYNDTRKHLLTLPINSNIHTAFVNLGVQLATGVIRDSNARFVALLDALKKMTKDYSLPPKTEFSRGLEAHLTLQLGFMSRLSHTEAAERDAVKFYRHLLTQLKHNVTEYEAKAHLQAEIDRYISEQIDKAGEAIGASVRSKISDGDNVLTYGFSSLVERILIYAHEDGVQFNTFVCGAGAGGAGAGAREMERRLAARGLSVAPVDIRNVTKYMCITNKVLLGATSVLNTGGVVAPAGTAVIAQQAHLSNVPVLVACERHKFSEQVQTDAFCNNTLADPADIIDASSELLNRPANPDLAVLNLTYDVTPPKFVTAVVTELAILPCTSAPIVHRIRSNAFNA